MLKLTATCERCGETKELDVTGRTISDDAIRKIGFSYVCGNLVCKKCSLAFDEYKEELELQKKRKECDFFKPTTEKE